MLLAALVLAPSVACVTPGPVVRLHPQGTDIVWVAGRGTVAREQAGVRVAMAFERQDGDRLAMRVEIQNDSASRIEIEPRQFTYQGCQTPAACRPWFAMIDPERELLKIDRKQAREKADQHNTAVAGTVFMLLSATTAIGAAASGDHHTASHAIHNGADVAESTSHAIDRSQARVGLLESEKSLWEGSALRRTTLFPSQGIAGALILPVDESARTVLIKAQIGGREMLFPFNQTVIEEPRYAHVGD